ncbi:MAG: metallophosphoesterase [Blastocatellia bacterium]|nr:metallophosphoesterase [Blastocatellia bacterium]MCS7157343.1 metallophosphoesterase [Blastocatellia bacterium]MCX7753209.1 metallophosphoesterase [Blastocatellia bacterium]MDW8168247.1 metallophosphoesterase [Acidobacteriota bacterium]MDW8255459.1 metallophosphoesterase [Acidobacteriota bacterium]
MFLREPKRAGVAASMLQLVRRAVDETRDIEIVRQRISLPELPSSFEGFTLAQLSDIHHSAFVDAAYIARAVALTNSLAPDVIVLTGDYVSHSRFYISGVAEILGELRARYGVYAVLGNHDFWTGPQALAHAFRRRGIELLRNAHTYLRKGGEALAMVGVDDLTLGQADLPTALRGMDRRWPALLLSHHPNIIWQAAHAGIALVLAGHTHGCQINIPSWRRRMRRFWPFLRGYGRYEQTHIYVNRGLGTVLIPLRYQCRPEITLLELKSASDQERAMGEKESLRACERHGSP